jgi:hypothetical protein
MGRFGGNMAVSLHGRGHGDARQFGGCNHVSRVAGGTAVARAVVVVRWIERADLKQQYADNK